MQMYIAIEPDEVKYAQSIKLPVAYSAYKIGTDGRLYRALDASQTERGLMILSADADDPDTDFDTVSEIITECKSRGFTGVIVNFEADGLLSLLAPVLLENKMRLVVHEPFGEAYKDAQVLISTALSGGTLKRRLSEAAEVFGAERIMLDVERICKDFTLPAPDGDGRTLSKTEFSDIMERISPTPYFSPELCCYYFSYTENGETHFVLYDNLNSIKNKLATAEALKINKAMFLYSETSNILHSLTH